MSTILEAGRTILLHSMKFGCHAIKMSQGLLVITETDTSELGRNATRFAILNMGALSLLCIWSFTLLSVSDSNFSMVSGSNGNVYYNITAPGSDWMGTIYDVQLRRYFDKPVFKRRSKE